MSQGEHHRALSNVLDLVFLHFSKTFDTTCDGIFFSLTQQIFIKGTLCAKHCIRCLFRDYDSEGDYEFTASKENKTKSKTDCLEFSLEQSRKRDAPHSLRSLLKGPLHTLSIKPCSVISYFLMLLYFSPVHLSFFAIILQVNSCT